MSSGGSRLKSHYDHKYRGADASEVAVVEARTHPRDRFEAMVAFAGSGQRLLEVGPGSGRVMLTLSDSFDYLVGVELSQVRAIELDRLFQTRCNVEIRCADIEMLDCLGADERYDVIVMSAVVEHLIEPIRVLRFLRDHLVPGGMLLLDTPNIAKVTRRVKLLCGRFPSTASVDEGMLMYDRQSPTDLYDEGHLHYFTYRSLKRLLVERAGFESVEALGYGGVLARCLPRLFSDCCLRAYANCD